MPVDPRFLKILDEIRSLHEKKSTDYGTEEDPYANVRASQEFGVPPWLGAVIRLHDKLVRIKAFTRNGSLKNESLEDSLTDIAVYAMISLLLWREEVEENTRWTVVPEDDVPF